MSNLRKLPSVDIVVADLAAFELPIYKSTKVVVVAARTLRVSVRPDEREGRNAVIESCLPPGRHTVADFAALISNTLLVGFTVWARMTGLAA